MAEKKKLVRYAENTGNTREVKKFTIEKVQENCQKLFGVSTSTFVGATYGMTGKYTIKEMKTHIDAWKGEGVG